MRLSTLIVGPLESIRSTLTPELSALIVSLPGPKAAFNASCKIGRAIEPSKEVGKSEDEDMGSNSFQAAGNNGAAAVNCCDSSASSAAATPRLGNAETSD